MLIFYGDDISWTFLAFIMDEMCELDEISKIYMEDKWGYLHVYGHKGMNMSILIVINNKG